jgi:hypothetical protein
MILERYSHENTLNLQLVLLHNSIHLDLMNYLGFAIDKIVCFTAQFDSFSFYNESSEFCNG